MSPIYTNEEWQKIVVDVEKSVKIDSNNDTKHEVPVDIARTIDHTLLKLDATRAQFDALCSEAGEHHFASVCVRPEWVQHCVEQLQKSSGGGGDNNNGVRVASVVGFHEGTYTLEQQVADAVKAVEAGAEELDIVVNWGQLQKQEYATISHELNTLRLTAPHPIVLKLILETSQLSARQILSGCILAWHADFEYVKTSTGFQGGGASVEDVRLMRAACEFLGRDKEEDQQQQLKNRTMLVKASGGIRSWEDAVKMLEAGASRLGTSGGVGIAREAKMRAEGDAWKGERHAESAVSTADY